MIYMKFVQGGVLVEDCGRANLEDFRLFMCLLYRLGGGEIELPATLVTSAVNTILRAAVSFLDLSHCHRVRMKLLGPSSIHRFSASSFLVWRLSSPGQGRIGD